MFFNRLISWSGAECVMVSNYVLKFVIYFQRLICVEKDDIVDYSVLAFSIYANFFFLFSYNSRCLEVPPPLPPRLPGRSTAGRPQSNSQSELSIRSLDQSETTVSSRGKQGSRKPSDVTFDRFSGGGLNCSSPRPTGVPPSNRWSFIPKHPTEN